MIWEMRFLGSRVDRGFVAVNPASFELGFLSGVLEQARRLGTSEADLLRSYPTLRAEDIVQAWVYVRTHRQEIELEIRENEDA